MVPEFDYIGEYVDIMASTAGQIDGRLTTPFHGNNNYVANLHLIYKVAWQIKQDNVDLSNYSTLCSFINNIDVQHKSGSTFQHVDISDAKAGLIELLSRASVGSTFPKVVSFSALPMIQSVRDSNLSGTTSLQKAWIVMGAAAHLLADVYAHRSMVPKASIGAGYFIKSNFVNGTDDSEWTLFKDRVQNKWIVEFRDIHTYSQSGPDADDVNLYSERYYIGACDSTYWMIFSFSQMFNFDAYYCMTPDNPGYSIRLNNFVTYIEHAGYSGINIPSVMTTNYRYDNRFDEDDTDYPHNSL